jgi:hypothetical protein
LEGGGGGGGCGVAFAVARFGAAGAALALGKGLMLLLVVVGVRGRPKRTWFMLKLWRMLFCQPLVSSLPLSVLSRNHW